MQIDMNRSRIGLARDGLVAVRDAKGTRVVCHTGSIWITQEGDSRDVILSSGESFMLREPGLTLITGLGRSELTIVEPGRSRAHSLWKFPWAAEPAGCAR